MKYLYAIFRLFKMPKCKHFWIIQASGSITNYSGGVTGSYYNLRCEHCGDMKRKNFEA